MTKKVYKIKCLSIGCQYEPEGYYETVEEFLKENPSLNRDKKRRWVRDLKSMKEIPIGTDESISCNQ